ncbi:MAG TPA: peptidoglycan DD-metalloendopeptidase family protein [Bacteroidales bacterium]|nr:peptidoglycan DD-metalloendopeptidase family protein [Bacteroidales bacterium]HQB21896.1 peptidoglycan DD-metalloendopeptidase family protein [Bacteroidales bacterium]
MKKLKYIILIFVVFLSISKVFPQSKSELEKKKNKTQQEINYINKLLKETQKTQKESYNNLLLINKNIESRRSIINDISYEIKLINGKIADIELIISIMEEDLENLKTHYANMIRVAWKNTNKYNNIMFILASEDFNQAYLRLKYMQQLANYRNKQFKAITALTDILAIQKQQLTELKNKNNNLLAEQRNEEKTLKNDQVKQESTIKKLKTQESDLKKKLQQQQKQMADLQREIERIIREEAKRNTNVATGKFELTPEAKLVGTNFEKNKGNLPWPVERGVIVSSFGKQKHPVLSNIEIDNRGVDISTTVGASIRAVFDGDVKQVLAMPGMQNVVIIMHGEYMSVYSHLETVLVSKGDKVLAKQVIGKVYTDKTENKTILHFEVWKSTSAVNPASWLSK